MSNPKLAFMQDLLLFKMRGEHGGGTAILSAARRRYAACDDEECGIDGGEEAPRVIFL